MAMLRVKDIFDSHCHLNMIHDRNPNWSGLADFLSPSKEERFLGKKTIKKQQSKGVGSKIM